MAFSSRVGRICVVEEDVIARACDLGVEVGGPAQAAMLLGQRLHLLARAADQHRVEHDARAVGHQHAALGADRRHRADQVLVDAHAARDAVHDEAEGALAHE
jgi:phage gp46-like protein